MRQIQIHYKTLKLNKGKTNQRTYEKLKWKIDSIIPLWKKKLKSRMIRAKLVNPNYSTLTSSLYSTKRMHERSFENPNGISHFIFSLSNVMKCHNLSKKQKNIEFFDWEIKNDCWAKENRSQFLRSSAMNLLYLKLKSPNQF